LKWAHWFLFQKEEHGILHKSDCYSPSTTIQLPSYWRYHDCRKGVSHHNSLNYLLGLLASKLQNAAPYMQTDWYNKLAVLSQFTWNTKRGCMQSKYLLWDPDILSASVSLFLLGSILAQLLSTRSTSVSKKFKQWTRAG
jgi:hypothetical protein